MAFNSLSSNVQIKIMITHQDCEVSLIADGNFVIARQDLKICMERNMVYMRF